MLHVACEGARAAVRAASGRSRGRARWLLLLAALAALAAVCVLLGVLGSPTSMCGAQVAVLRPDRHVLTAVAVAGRGSHATGAVRASVASAVSALTAGAAVPTTITFVVTNLAYAELTLNFFRIAARLEPPLAAAFSVAVDAAARDRLAAAAPRAYATVFEAAGPAYESNVSVFGGRAYNSMTEHKWRVAAAVLATGQHALMVDPDVALLRNPAQYLDAAPQCDLATMIEVNDGDASPVSLRAQGGFAFDAFANWVNTGFVLFRSSPRTGPFVAAFLEYLAQPAARAENRDDQHHFNTYLHMRLRPRGLRPDATLAERGQLLIDAMVARRCIDLVDAAAAEDGATHLSWLPLSPLLFMNRIALDKFALHERALDKPYAVHHNWLLGLEEKVCSLRAHGQWAEADA